MTLQPPPSPQLDLFRPAPPVPVAPVTPTGDLATGRALRDAGIAQADAHAPDFWRTAALAAVHYLAAHRAEFTTDAVWALLDQRGVAPPPEPRAMGGVMRRAVYLGWITKTGRVVETVRPSAHASPIAIWASVRPLPACVLAPPQ